MPRVLSSDLTEGVARSAAFTEAAVASHPAATAASATHSLLPSGALRTPPCCAERGEGRSGEEREGRRRDDGTESSREEEIRMRER